MNITITEAEYEALKARAEHWYERFSKLEIQRASCCWENEKKVDELTSQLEDANKEIAELEDELEQLAIEIDDCPRDH